MDPAVEDLQRAVYLAGGTEYAFSSQIKNTYYAPTGAEKFYLGQSKCYLVLL